MVCGPWWVEARVVAAWERYSRSYGLAEKTARFMVKVDVVAQCGCVKEGCGGSGGTRRFVMSKVGGEVLVM